MTLAEKDSQTAQAEIRRLLEEAEAGGASDAYAGKRGATRFTEGVQLEVATEPFARAETWPVTMHNLSEGGFAFHSRRSLDQGAIIYVREFNSDAPAVWLRARVRHRTRSLQGFLIGASFDPDASAEHGECGTGGASVPARLPRPI